MGKADDFWDDVQASPVEILEYKVENGCRFKWHWFEHCKRFGWKSVGRILPKDYQVITVEQLKQTLQQQAEAAVQNWSPDVKMAWATGLHETLHVEMTAMPAPPPMVLDPGPNLAHQLWQDEYGF